MTTSLVPVQTAIYEELVASGLFGTRVYDEVPESGEARFPYCEIGEWDGAPDDVVGGDGGDDALTLNMWSRHKGKKEILNLMDGVRRLFHAKTLITADKESVHLFVTFQRTFREANGVDRRGVVVLRVLHHIDS